MNMVTVNIDDELANDEIRSIEMKIFFNKGITNRGEIFARVGDAILVIQNVIPASNEEFLLVIDQKQWKNWEDTGSVSYFEK